MKYAVLLLWVPLIAQHTPAWPTTPANCEVNGQVVNSVTGLPVAGAVVTIYNKHAFRLRDGGIAITDTTIRPPEASPQDNPRSITSDGQGRFSFTGLEPGSYVMAAIHDSYLRTPYNPYTPISGGVMELPPGTTKRGLTIRLRPQSVVSGQVTGADGEPLSGAKVSLVNHLVGQHGRELVREATAVTNERGEYQIAGVEPKKYFLRVEPPVRRSPAATTNGGTRLDYLPVFYPSSRSAEGAVPVAVDEGQEVRHLNVIVPRGQTPLILGTIATHEGFAAVSVYAMSKELGVVPGTITDHPNAPATFEISGLTPGPHVVYASASGAGQVHETWMRVDVEPSGLAGVELRPEPPVAITGHVDVEGVPGAKLSRVQLSLENSFSVDAGAIAVPVQEDGSFVIKSVPAAVYRLTPRYTMTGYVKAVRFGNVDVTDSAIDLSRGSAAGELVVTLGANGGRIRGLVTDENGVGAAGSTIALLPIDRSSDVQRARAASKLTFPDAKGHFGFAGIAPGRYMLLAWKLGVADGKTVLYDLDFVKPYEQRAQVIQVEPGTIMTVDLKALQ